MRTHLLLVAATATALQNVPVHADITISNNPTQNMSCDAGVCTATAQKAVLNVGDLQTVLASGDVAVKTGSVTNDIDIDQPLTWSGTSRLTLDAQRSVTVKRQMTVTGQGALTIITNDGGKDGEFVIVPKHASIQFWDLSSNLVIDGRSYTLVGDIKTLATRIAANPAGFYAMASPYDADQDGSYNVTAISTTFEGILEGLGNPITHFSLSVSTAQELTSAGFFTSIGSSASVRDWYFIDASLTASGPVDYMGVLAGLNAGLILSSYTSGAVVVGSTNGVGPELGGLIGRNFGIISNSSASVAIDVKYFGTAGGLVGSDNGDIVKSSSKGRIIAGNNSRLGGLAGNAGCFEGTCPTISYSRATGDVEGGDYACAGGLIGASYARVIASFATGNVTVGRAQNFRCSGVAGGLVGLVGKRIENSYATGRVRGYGGYVGGFVGAVPTGHDSPSAHIATSLSIGKVSGANNSGGFIGYEKTTKNFVNSYWDTDTSRTDRESGNGLDSAGVTGLTDAQLKSALPAGFDPAVWGQNPNINDGYPYLLANPPQ